MSKDYMITWPAHTNIYNNHKQRDFNIYFSEPDNGVSEETGLLLLIPGFGGNANSNVYNKMRSNFADQYNLVTVQCDYFGQEFMQNGKSVNLNISRGSLLNIFNDDEINHIFADGFDVTKFLSIGSKYDLQIKVNEALNETEENFNDMGIMQALDNITSILYVMKILEDNQLKFNAKRIILYGHSHGAYLSYLCNAFAPNLFSLLIDNSSWLFPTYLTSKRYLFTKVGKMLLNVEFDYLSSHRFYDKYLLSLPTLYSQFENKCSIQCYHGTTDNLITSIEKRDFCDNIKNCTFEEISSDKVDGFIFKSTNHGLDADFLKLFDYAISKENFKISDRLKLDSVTFETRVGKYIIDYSSGLPQLLNTINLNLKIK